MKILLLENKDICIDALLAALGSSRIIETCSTVEEAQKKLTTFKPDVVLISNELWPMVKDYELPQDVGMVIFTSSLWMDRARSWFDTSILEDALKNAERRKEAFARVQHALDAQERLLEKAVEKGEKSGINMRG